MKILHRIAFCILLLASVAGWADVLRTAAQEGSAPKYIDAGAHAQGHCPDLLRALEKADPTLHIEIDPTPTPIKRLESGLKAGNLDLVCALLDTPLRKQIAYRVSTPLFHLRECLVGRRDDAIQIRNFKELAATGSLVMTQVGASYAADLRSKGVQVLENSGGTTVALRNVANQRARFYYTNDLTGAYYIHLAKLGDQLHLLPDVLQETPSYLWVSRRLDPAIAQRLEKAVAKLRDTGELERIYRNYLSKP